MANLTSLSLQLDNKTGTCRALIETPKGCRNTSGPHTNENS
jgi:hypothetical protein